MFCRVVVGTAALVVKSIAVKLVAVPPLVEFAKATVICAEPAVTELIVGVPGLVTAKGVTDTALEAALLPTALVALTVQL